MTKEQKALKNLKDILAEATMDENSVCYVTEEDKETLDMAIKALEQQPSYDCVDRNHIIATISHHHFDNDKDNFDLLIHNLCKEVKELPPVTPTQSWIPVSEKLPESEGLYLVSVKNDRLRQYSKTCWFNSHRNWFSRQDVIAWQPLPQPYEDKRGNEND